MVKQGELYPPYIAKKTDEPVDAVTRAICQLHKKSPVYLHQGMIRPWTPRSVYIERVSGRTYNGQYTKLRGQYENVTKYTTLTRSVTDKKDMHYSTFGHDHKWVANVKKTGSVTCNNTFVYLYRLFFDIDRDDFADAQSDTQKLCERLDLRGIDYNVWHTGGRGYHVELPGHLFGHVFDQQERICGRGKLVYNLAHDIAGDFRFENGISDPHFTPNGELIKAYYDMSGNRIAASEIKKHLENIDPNLYYTNSTLRRPYTLHEKTGDPKRPVSPKTFQPVTPKTWPVYPHPNHPPHFLHTVYDNYRPKKNPNPARNIKSVDAATGVIVELFEEYFPDFDADRANSKGWVDGLYNPLYKDGNPSVGVNIHTGAVKDFGNPDYDMDIITLISKHDSITRRKAKEIVGQRKAEG